MNHFKFEQATTPERYDTLNIFENKLLDMIRDVSYNTLIEIKNSLSGDLIYSGIVRCIFDSKELEEKFKDYKVTLVSVEANTLIIDILQ